MPDVARGEQFTALKIPGCLADQYAIHDDVLAGSEILREELMFGGHVRQENVVTPGKADDLAFMQIGQSNEDVVARVESQNFSLRRIVS